MSPLCPPSSCPGQGFPRRWPAERTFSSGDGQVCRAAASLPKGAKEQPRADGTGGREQGLPPCARAQTRPRPAGAGVWRAAPQGRRSGTLDCCCHRGLFELIKSQGVSVRTCVFQKPRGFPSAARPQHPRRRCEHAHSRRATGCAEGREVSAAFALADEDASPLPAGRSLRTTSAGTR